MIHTLSRVLFFVLTVSLVLFGNTQIGFTQKATSPPNPIIIGVPTSMGHPSGRVTLQSVKLAAEEINAKGGVVVKGTKRPLEVVSIDTRETDPGIPIHDALAAVEKLILEKKPHAICVGAYRSEVLLASMDLIAKYKIPYLCSIAVTPKFEEVVASDAKYRYAFRVCGAANHAVAGLSNVLDFLKKEFGFNKLYIVLEDILWAQGLSVAVQNVAKTSGWEVVGADGFPWGASEFSSSLAKIKDQKVQVIVPFFTYPESIALPKQARAMNVPSIFAGAMTAVDSEEAWETTKGEVEGVVSWIWEAGQIPVKAIPKSVHYNKTFGERWGIKARKELMGHCPGPSYDTVYIVASAIERAGTLDADALVAALEKTDIRGSVGRIRFNKTHQVIYGSDPNEAAVGVAYQWKKPGIRVPVFPSTIAEGKIELPPQLK